MLGVALGGGVETNPLWPRLMQHLQMRFNATKHILLHTVKMQVDGLALLTKTLKNEWLTNHCDKMTSLMLGAPLQVIYRE